MMTKLILSGKHSVCEQLQILQKKQAFFPAVQPNIFTYINSVQPLLNVTRSEGYLMCFENMPLTCLSNITKFYACFPCTILKCSKVVSDKVTDSHLLKTDDI